MEEQTVIVVGSVTYALHGQRLLQARGLRAYVERLQRTPETGCGYGLYVPGATAQAEKILRAAGVHVLAVVPWQGRDVQ